MTDIPQDVMDVIPTDRYHPYVNASPDKNVDGMVWFVAGLIDTNEIIVVCKYRDKVYSKKEESPAALPTMADRCFGIDVSDHGKALELSDKLFTELKEQGVIDD